MVDEIRKNGLTFKDAKNMVDISIRDVKDGFVATGYYLWVIREGRLWEENGYNSFQEFLHCQYQKDKSWASRCIGLYEQFGKKIEFGEVPVLAAPYRDYSVSQLIEMVSMTDEQRELVTPEMKVREIREMKPKREKKETVPEEEVSAEAAGGEPEEQLPGQMELIDYGEDGCDVATGDGQEAAQEPPKEAEMIKNCIGTEKRAGSGPGGAGRGKRTGRGGGNRRKAVREGDNRQMRLQGRVFLYTDKRAAENRWREWELSCGLLLGV